MVPKVESRSNRGAELLGLVAFALALMLLIALATFDPRDPAPFFKAGADATARNFIGPFGAFLAELLIPQLFGLAALLVPLALGLIGWKLFWCRPIEAPYTKAVGNLFLLLTLSSLLALTLRHRRLRRRAGARRRGDRRGAGGAPGQRLQPHRGLHRGRDRALRRAHPVDAVLLLGLPRGHGRRASAIGCAGLQTAFAHYRENRRKEKMRREVIRKHAVTRDEAAGLPKIRRVEGRGRGRARRRSGGRAGRRPAAPGRRSRRRGPRRSSFRSSRRAAAAQSRRRPRPRPSPRRPGRDGAARRRTPPRPPRRAAATRCPRSPSSTRRKAAHSSTTTACSSAARSCS